MAPLNSKVQMSANKKEDIHFESLDIDKRLQYILKKGAETPADLDLPDLELPDYFDEEKFKLGQQAFYNNAFTMMIAKLSGLLTLLAIPSILDILIFTKQSGTPCTAFRRYVSTILHTFVWYEKQPVRESEFFKSLKNVRKKHCIVSRRSKEGGLRRITQLDMALTQFGFIGFTLLSKDQLGVVLSKAELEGLVHLWRVIGNLLGMEEIFNICSGTPEECRAICQRFLDDIFLPCLSAKNEKFEEMGHILVEGLWPVNPYLNPKAYMAFTKQLAVTSSTNNNHSIDIDTKSLPLVSKILLNMQLSVHQYLMPAHYWWSGIFRAIFNHLMRNAIFWTEKLPYLAYFSCSETVCKVCQGPMTCNPDHLLVSIILNEPNRAICALSDALDVEYELNHKNTR